MPWSFYISSKLGVRFFVAQALLPATLYAIRGSNRTTGDTLGLDCGGDFSYPYKAAAAKFQAYIASVEGAEAVGDHERRAIFHQALECFEDQPFGPRVHCAGWVVENLDRRIREGRTRHGNALALAA